MGALSLTLEETKISARTSLLTCYTAAGKGKEEEDAKDKGYLKNKN